MRQVSRRHILSQSRSDVTYCPDVIEAGFAKVCDIRSECQLTLQSYSVFTVSESCTAVSARWILESKGKARRRIIEIMTKSNQNQEITTAQTIQSVFIHAISIAPLQVHYHSEALPTQYGYCAGISR